MTPDVHRPPALRRTALALAALLVAVTAGYGCRQASAAEGDREAATYAFRNAVNEPPEGWSGPVFALSHDYPTELPAPCGPGECPWLGIDVDFSVDFDTPPATWGETNWPAYIAAIKEYVRQGQDPMLSNEVGFLTEVDGQDRWFHVPWMAYDSTAGREFVHGTTNERTSHLSDLLGANDGFGVNELPNTSAECADLYPEGFETWAVGVYNPTGGYAIGQSWPASGRPRIGTFEGSAMPAGLPFAEGTVVAKFLFTTAPVACVPYLAGAPEWQVNRHVVQGDASKAHYTCPREVQTVRLVQVDVAVVDERSPTRWVYGTFGFNGTIEATSIWDQLDPVGIQWGSDPWTFPAVPRSESTAARQTVLNDEINIYEHFGCEGRLAGPVDNEKSACMACHASAYAAPGGAVSAMGSNTPASFGFAGLCDRFTQQNADYFQNNMAPAGYSGGQYPDALNLDTSLQMWVAFSQYGQFNTAGAPAACQMGG